MNMPIYGATAAAGSCSSASAGCAAARGLCCYSPEGGGGCYSLLNLELLML
jgi:hypothetical protein